MIAEIPFQLPCILLLMASSGAMSCYLAPIVGCSAFHVVARPVGLIQNE